MSGRKIVFGLVIVLVAAALVVIGTPSLNRPLTKLLASSGPEIVTYLAKLGTLTVTVNEKGSLESAENKDVLSEVEGTTSIIFILPEGTKVKKGDRVCELDSATLRDTHKNQLITTEQAKASFQQAKLTREVAEVAVKEYEFGTFKQDYEGVIGEVALAEADLVRAKDRLEYTTRMAEKGYVSEAQKLSDKYSLDKSTFSLEQAQTKKKVLLEFSKEKNLKEYRAEVEKAHSDELAKEATFELEKSKQEKLERQIKACLLVAPGDGLVVYANDPNRFGGQNQVQIEEGASVRERQKIFSLPDISQMRVNTKVHESMVDRIQKGMASRVRVDAFASEGLQGKVNSVAPLPDPNTFFGSDIKVYTTQVAIENGPSGLRPGMTAQVEILVAQIPNVISIPVQAVLEFKEKDYVFIKNGDRYDRTEVTLGTSNDRLVEIKTGLKENQEVAMTPTLLLTSEEKREAFGGPAGAGKKDWAPGSAGSEPPPATPKGDAAKGGEPGKEKAKRKGGAGGGMGGPMGAIFQKIPAEDRARMRTASEAERTEILKKAGATDEMIEQMKQMRANGGGPGGPGGGGGGFGGPGGGGPPQ